jgi:hypothetical protein
MNSRQALALLGSAAFAARARAQTRPTANRFTFHFRLRISATC